MNVFHVLNTILLIENATDKQCYLIVDKECLHQSESLRFDSSWVEAKTNFLPA